MSWRLAVRDTALALAAVEAFLLDAWLRSAGAESMGVAVMAAAFASAAAFYAHEWGHWIAARAVGAVVYPSESIFSLFLFRFDTVLSDARQFVAMSYGGFIASALVLVVALVALPLDAFSGRLTLALILLGIAATVITEFPVAWSVAHGGPMPTGVVYVSDTSRDV